VTEDIVARLHRHRCLTGMRTVIDDAADEIELLRAERDEARREVCEILERDAGFAAQRQAASRGWNCYKADIA
jgi:hypothetical protein